MRETEEVNSLLEQGRIHLPIQHVSRMRLAPMKYMSGRSREEGSGVL